MTTRRKGAHDAPPQDTPPPTDRPPAPGRRSPSDPPLAGSGPRPITVHNRIRTIMIHVPRYSFQGQARLAADAGVSRSTISRLLRGRTSPSFRLARAVTAALEKHLGRPLDPRELLSPDGSYPTPSGCDLTGCRGCFPDEAYDAEGNLRSEYEGLRPGDWSLAQPSDTPLNVLQASDPQSSEPSSSNHRKESR